jgi:hypothetical protein
VTKKQRVEEGENGEGATDGAAKPKTPKKTKILKDSDNEKGENADGSVAKKEPKEKKVKEPKEKKVKEPKEKKVKEPKEKKVKEPKEKKLKEPKVPAPKVSTLLTFCI